MKYARYLSVLLALALLPTPVTAACAEEAKGGSVEIVEMAPYDPEARGKVTVDPRLLEPHIPDGVEKTVIGMDNRVTVTNTAAYPYSAIAYLDCSFTCGCVVIGNGFLVAPDVMMSASHIAYCGVHYEPLQYLTAYFGYRNEKNYLYKYDKGTTFWYNPEFFAGDGQVYYEFDYSYFKLDERVGDYVGTFGIAPWSDEELQYAVVQVAGYQQGVMKIDNDFLFALSDRGVVYENDTEPGSSGCPVFTNTQDGYSAVAINVAAAPDVNYGCRLTWDILEEMIYNGVFD